MPASLPVRVRSVAKVTAAASFAAAVLAPALAAAAPLTAVRPKSITTPSNRAELRIATTAQRILDREEAARTKAPPPPAEPVTPAPAPDPAEVAIAEAHRHLGKPYRWGGTGPDGFDCSGLMLASWRAAGVELPRTSGAQYAGLQRVPLEEMQRGDLVFSGYGSIGHVGLYLGDGMMIHSPRSGKRVEVSPLHKNVIGAGRVVP